MTPETKLKNDVQKFLNDLRVAGLPLWFFKTHACGYSKSGIPDLAIICLGCSLWVELKAAKGKASPIQLRRIDEIREAQGQVRICRSVREVAAFVSAAVESILGRPGFLAEEFPTAYGVLLKNAEATAL